jgi:hypothetical protein
MIRETQHRHALLLSGEVPLPGLRIQLVALGAVHAQKLALSCHGHHVQVQFFPGHRHGGEGNFF